MTEYYVNKTTKTVDGSAYTSDDTIIIRGGARDGLLLKNFDGRGSYIPIINEDGTSKVKIDGMSGHGCLSISKCKYIDLRGNNDGRIPYGIKVINDNTSQTPGTIWVYGESDHIKLGHLEATCEGSTVTAGNGVFIQDPYLTAAWTWDTIEIHHNWIHDTRYAGMYLGMNTPAESEKNKAHLANMSVHDNLFEDLGAYGITVKGVRSTSGRNRIYNNTIQGSSGGQSTGLVTTKGNVVTFGIGGADYYGINGVDIFNNRIDKTLGNGIHVGVENQNVHNNVICGCGTCNEVAYGNGIMTWWYAKNAHIYGNVIIQPGRYGIYAAPTTQSARMSRNLIGDAGIGEWYAKQEGDLTESTGADANIYHANVADFGFAKWTNDGDYRNDDFSFITEAPQGRIVSLNYPLTVQHGATVDINAAIKNIGELSGLFKMQLWRDGVLKATSPQFILAGGETSADKINPFTAPTTGEKMAMAIKCIRTEE